ncbi:hypothetical protein G7072_06790 [Nocardioides sp. HDW12B]|uniref:TadE/TadG family type IV pilus assembly protein n=1 Tax=Nocardioides sp. HDW12B TaxID=2714939 RepID=UPI001407B77D|nr:TadE/TadG family type IV pilus assembly protein [Nocardioides sp. HDW12B]QIK66087.1 hypothetical protein G7072_06790 [Nocardioides sp. HDW12B]
MSRASCTGRASARAESGVAAVEVALLVPLVLLLVAGLIQYGFYFSAQQGGSAAAREAARRAAVGAPTSCDAFRSEVGTNVAQVATGGLDIRRDFGDANANSKVDIGENVTVTVVFQSRDLDLPFLPFVDGGLVTKKATARVDYLPDSTIADCL